MGFFGGYCLVGFIGVFFVFRHKLVTNICICQTRGVCVCVGGGGGVGEGCVCVCVWRGGGVTIYIPISSTYLSGMSTSRPKTDCLVYGLEAGGDKENKIKIPKDLNLFAQARCF